MALAITAVIALAAGYLLGRARPFDRLDTWVWRQFTFVGPWMTGSKPRQAVLMVAHAIARPVMTWDIWRHRHDPKPPRRSPAVAVRRATDPNPTTDDNNAEKE